jgi:hypothetical protein
MGWILPESLHPWTALLVTRQHTKLKLRKEYEMYLKTDRRKAEAARKDGFVTPFTHGK